MVYHPRMDSLTEWTNQKVEAYLQLYCSDHPETWSDHLTDIEFVHNTRMSEVTKHTPFQIMMGYQPRTISIDSPMTHVPAAQEHLEVLKKIWSEVEATLELSQRKMAQRGKGNQLTFAIGDKVWLENTHLWTRYPYQKLTPK